MGKKLNIEQAVVDGHLKKLRQALADGADPNGCVKEWTGKEFRSGPSLIFKAVQSGRLPICQALFEAGADVHGAHLGRSLASWALDARKEALALWVIGVAASVPQAIGPREISIAAEWGCSAVLAKLLESGANPDEGLHGAMSPLRIACSFGKSKAVGVLLDAGADPNLANGGGLSPLALAARARQPEAMELLLNAGAKPDWTGEEGFGVLGCLASKFACADSAALLLEKGLSPTRLDVEAAAKSRNHKLLKLLLEAHPEAGAGVPLAFLAAASEEARLRGVGVSESLMAIASCGFDIDGRDASGGGAFEVFLRGKLSDALFFVEALGKPPRPLPSTSAVEILKERSRYGYEASAIEKLCLRLVELGDPQFSDAKSYEGWSQPLGALLAAAADKKALAAELASDRSRLGGRPRI